MEWQESFSRKNPLNSRIRDTDVFLHGTSLKKYRAMQSKGFLLTRLKNKNFSISQNGICFEKYDEHGKYSDMIKNTIRNYCETACRNDQSSEGVILRIKGRELKKLGCPIYADWNKNYIPKYNNEGIPIDVDYNAPFLSIIVVDTDIPLECLEEVRRISFKD